MFLGKKIIYIKFLTSSFTTKNIFDILFVGNEYNLTKVVITIKPPIKKSVENYPTLIWIK